MPRITRRTTKGACPGRAPSPEEASEETKPVESQGQARVSCYWTQPRKTGWFSDGASEPVFHFTNSTLAATDRMNQSLLPHAFCQTGLFLSCRSPNFTHRQGFQAKPNRQGPRPQRPLEPGGRAPSRAPPRPHHVSDTMAQGYQILITDSDNVLSLPAQRWPSRAAGPDGC